MKIFETSVKKPISTALIFIGVIVLGLFSLQKLSIDFYPEIDPPMITVFTYYTGASAADIETNVTRILENNLSTVNNLKKITSSSKENISLITLEFEWGQNLDEASNDIRDAISRCEKLLPEASEKPMIFKFNTSMIPVIFLSATATESYNGLYKILDDKVANPINRIDGVAAVSISGAPEREIQVNVDPYKIEAYNLSVEQIGQAVQRENINMPAGNIDLGQETYSLRINGEFLQSDQIKNIVVANYNGKPVYMRDVAVVKDTVKEQTLREKINGREGARIIIQKQSGANTVKIAEKIVAMVPELQKNLPSDVKLEVMNDTSVYIKDSISSLSDTVMYAAIFVILVVLFFLGRWRASLIIILTIPVSLIVAFIYLFISGNTLNIISLSSLSIAIGMVVDDAIVVMENITKHVERGSKPREAAIYATNEVWLAVIATTLTVVAVFMPLTMVSGIAGVMFKQLGWSVSLVIVVSTIAAITLTPMLSSIMMKAENIQTRKVSRIYRPIERGLDKLDIFYGKLVHTAVRRRKSWLIFFILVFVGSLFLFKFIGTEFMPTADNGQIGATVELQQGVSVDYTETVVDSITKFIQEEMKNELMAMSSSYGIPDANNIFASFSKNGSNIVSITLRLTPSTERSKERSMFALSEVLRKHLEQYPEIKKFIVSPGGSRGGMGMGGSSTVDAKIIGHDFEATSEFANALRDSIVKNIPGARDVDVDRDEFVLEYNVDFDRDKLSEHGLNTATAATYISNRMNGMLATFYREDGDEYDVRIRYDKQFRESIENIENITLYTPQGQGVKVKEVGTVVERYSPPSINRENRQRVVTVTSGMEGTTLGALAEDIQKQINKMEIPTDVDVVLGGSLEDQQESFGDLGALFLIVIMLVYIVMATQFESFKMPFIIILSLPFAISGVFIALFLTGETLNVVSIIGLIMLVGIVVKNGIVMVDFTNLLRERGMSLHKAVVESGKSRLRPVLMTSLTTILGMLPLALAIGEGSATWKPMGITVIGGLAFSTLITLVIIPIVYTLFGMRTIKKTRKKFRKLYGNTMIQASNQ